MALTLDDIAIPAPGPDQTLDLAEIFGREAPVEFELGIGKGGFLLERARSLPDVDFIGVEWANKFFRYAADRMARWGMNNVRVMRADARHLLIHHLPERCLAALHVYHPDPWPKKRHHKRRLFQPAFAAALARTLELESPLYVQTDHEEYFEWTREIISGEPGLEVIWAGRAEEQPGAVMPRTNFEIKYRREGRRFFSLQAHARES